MAFVGLATCLTKVALWEGIRGNKLEELILRAFLEAVFEW